MMIGRRVVHLLALTGLAVLVALSVDRVVQPAITKDLILTAVLGVVVGIPGLVNKKLGLLGLLTVPLGLYLLLRLASPLPANVETWHEQWVFYADQLHFGLAAYGSDIFPLTLQGMPELRLLVLVSVYVVTALAASLALDGQHPLLGVGVLLSFLAFGLTVDGRSAEIGLVAVFILASAFVLLTSHALSRRRWGLRDAAIGLGVGGVGFLIAYVVLSSSPGIAAPGWQDWREWDPFGAGRGDQVAFTWNLNYPRMLDPGNEVPIFQVTSELPTYWQANTLELFNGHSWLTAAQDWTPLGTGPGAIDLPPREPEPPGTLITERFRLGQVTTTLLFAGGSPQALLLEEPTRLYVTSGGALQSEVPVDSPYEYSVEALLPQVQPAELVGLGRDYPPGLETYLSLPLPSAAEVRADAAVLATLEEDAPGSYPGRRFDRTEFNDLYALSRSVVGDATDPYQQIILIERWLRSSYLYSLDVPPSAYSSPIAAFLFETKTGYCQHFAGAMTLLLRLNGIPARVAVGFTSGALVEEQTYQVTSNNAHAWVEAYFPGVGWLPFDPTPSRALPLAGASTSSPGFVDPFPQQGPAETQATPTIPGTTRMQADEGGGAETPITLSSAKGVLLPSLVGAAALLALAAAWPFIRRRVRERGLRRGDSRSRLLASLELLRRDLAQNDISLTPATTLAELADAVDRLGMADLRPLADRADAVMFGGRTATDDDVIRAEVARREVNLWLSRRQGRLWSILTWYGLAVPARRGLARLDRTAQGWKTSTAPDAM